MSLQVWLPLNGNANNQGISPLTINSSNASYKNGKTGQGLNLSTQINCIALGMAGATKFSVCFWSYCDTDTSKSADWCRLVYLYDATSTNTDGSGFRFETCYSSSLNSRGVSWHNNGTNAISDGSVMIGGKNQWHHICVTCEAGHIKTYDNGILVNDYPSTKGGHLTGQFYLGSNVTGCLNDFRLYDHCLSPKEVSEIAKGLVLHYPLNNGGFGNENLVKNTNVDSTSYFGLSEEAGGSTKEIVYDNGIPCVNVTRNSTEHSGWHYIWHNSVDLDKIKTNTNYTVSLDVKASVSGTMSLIGLLNGNATNYMTNSATSVKNQYIANTWSHLVFNMKTISSFSDISVGSQVVYFHSNALLGTRVSFMIKNFKLEEGLKPTSWIPNGADALYSAMGLNSTTVADCSGFNNNGTRSGTLTYSSDSPRYSGSLGFTGSQYIKSNSATWQGGSLNDTTIAFWLYTNTSSCGGAGGIMHESPKAVMTMYNNVWQFSNGTSWINYNNGGTDVNKWSHYACTLKDNVINIYKNGELISTNTNTSIITDLESGNYVALGCDFPGGDEYLTGKLSDFRIYATALSEADIKALYNTPISLDKSGNLYASEFKEV